VEILKHVQNEDVVVLEITGEVDAYTAQNFNQTLVDIFDQGYRRIVLDVSKITFISSAGVRTILFAYREANQLQGEIRLVGPVDQVRRTFEIAGFFELITITDELQDALNNW